MIKHVFFDLDHTLYDFERNSALAFERIFKEEQIPLKLKDFLDIYIPINNEYWKKYRENKVSKQALRFGRLNDTMLKLNLELKPDFINKLAQRYIEVLPSFNHLFPGSLEVLHYLQAKDYSLHLITNGFEEVQMKKCIAAGIDHFFIHYIYSESVGVKKPNPLIFEYALEQAGASPDESIMIGDNLEADIMGALNKEMHVIYCNFNDSPSNSIGVKEVKNLLELKEIL